MRPFYVNLPTKRFTSMKRTMLTAIIAATMVTTACDDNGQKEAELMLEQARTQLTNKQYDEALHTIDSMRKTYPKAIEARKTGLKLHQDIALSQAQEDLAKTDSALQRVKSEYEAMKAAADKAKSQLQATPEQLTLLTLKRMERDSLQVRFDMQCAKIKYIHKRQKE